MKLCMDVFLICRFCNLKLIQYKGNLHPGKNDSRMFSREELPNWWALKKIYCYFQMRSKKGSVWLSQGWMDGKKWWCSWHLVSGWRTPGKWCSGTQRSSCMPESQHMGSLEGGATGMGPWWRVPFSSTMGENEGSAERKDEWDPVNCCLRSQHLSPRESRDI